MTTFDAMYMAQTLHRRPAPSDQSLDDVEVILQDLLEEVRTVKRCRRTVYEMQESLCPVLAIGSEPTTW